MLELKLIHVPFVAAQYPVIGKAHHSGMSSFESKPYLSISQLHMGDLCVCVCVFSSDIAEIS